MIVLNENIVFLNTFNRELPQLILKNEQYKKNNMVSKKTLFKFLSCFLLGSVF